MTVNECCGLITDRAFCVRCGKRVRWTAYCGHVVYSTWKRCGECGEPVLPYGTQPSRVVLTETA